MGMLKNNHNMGYQMSKLEPGCKAIIIDGEQNLDHETNIGKIVTVIGFIGKIAHCDGDDLWEVDKPMIGSLGGSMYFNRAKNMQRIDDNDATPIETKQEIESEA